MLMSSYPPSSPCSWPRTHNTAEFRPAQNAAILHTWFDDAAAAATAAAAAATAAATDAAEGDEWSVEVDVEAEGRSLALPPSLRFTETFFGVRFCSERFKTHNANLINYLQNHETLAQIVHATCVWACTHQRFSQQQQRLHFTIHSLVTHKFVKYFNKHFFVWDERRVCSVPIPAWSASLLTHVSAI